MSLKSTLLFILILSFIKLDVTNAEETFGGISLDNLRFQHPMTVVKSSELEIIRYRIKNRKEPQYSAFQVLIINANRVMNFEPDPPKRMLIMGGYEKNTNLPQMRAWLWRNSHAAYTCALAWKLTDEECYANKAVTILMSWANQNTTFSGTDSALQIGSHFTPMLYAFDLLYDHDNWPKSQRDIFETFWRERCLIHTKGKMKKQNNWGDNCLMGVFAAGIAFEDRSLIQDSLERLNEYFEGSWKFKNKEGVSYLPAEVTRNNGHSGLTYTAYALTALVQVLEMAMNCGYDWWSRKTANRVSLKEVIEDYFDWMILGASFPWSTNPKRYTKSYRGNVFEVANTRLSLKPEIACWLAMNRPIDGRQGDEYSTLLKGLEIVTKTNMIEQPLPADGDSATFRSPN